VEATILQNGGAVGNTARIDQGVGFGNTATNSVALIDQSGGVGNTATITQNN